MTRFDARTELDAFTQAALDIVRLLAEDERRLSLRAPNVSGWSAVEHASHVTLANELILRNLVNLSRGSGMLVVADAVQNERALAVLAGGVLPRGEVKSPRMVVPPSDVDLKTAREWADAFARDLADFRRDFDPDAERPRLYVSHQTLGPLDLAQWIRFGGAHSRHHVAIAREVLAAVG